MRFPGFENDASPDFGAAMTRRRVGGVLAAVLATALIGGCGNTQKWHAIDVSGSTPPLAFTMTRASDGKTVTAADYRGDIVLLYFGYTYCPDVCPTTLSNVATILGRMGAEASKVQVLFVTVDPNRDTLPLLKGYAKAFSPRIDALRGTPDQLAELARRYRIVYSVSPATKDHPYEVTHSSAIYVFDQTGEARLLIASLATTTPDIAGTADDLERLARSGSPPSFVARLLRLV
jgi:protein SCO1